MDVDKPFVSLRLGEEGDSDDHSHAAGGRRVIEEIRKEKIESHPTGYFHYFCTMGLPTEWSSVVEAPM